MKNYIEEVKKISVSHCTSTRTGEAVKNQYIIHAPGVTAFQSYDSLIAVYVVEDDRLILGRHFDYSVTTSKYLGQFLREYCWSIYKALPVGKSLKDSLQKAINAGLIEYDSDMV